MGAAFMIGDPLVEAEAISVEFPAGRVGRTRRVLRAVDRVSLAIARGETLGIVGESGSGKSTLGRAVMRMVGTTEGTVRFAGQNISDMSGRQFNELRPQMQMIFQDPAAALDPRLSTGSSIEEAFYSQRRAPRSVRREKVAELLDLVGLGQAFAERLPHEMSGGQRQRVVIARAIASRPRFIVCDEPVSGLDVSVQGQILNLLQKFKKEFGLSYLFITHNLAVVRLVSDRVAIMYLGKLVEHGTVEAIFARPAHPYTRALLSAVPTRRAGQTAPTRIVLKGDIPSPLTPPPGCRFHTRCWLYERLGRPEVCHSVAPPLTVVDGGHSSACHFAGEVGSHQPAGGEARRGAARAQETRGN
jgi:oligopeptide/dipeptide ABC transporter ATP-binding protein